MTKKKQHKKKKTGQTKDLHISGKKPVNFLLIAILAISLFSILIYSNSMDCAFQFDDEGFISYDTSIKNISSFFNLSVWFGKGILNRPLSRFTFALNYHINDLNVFGYHLLNLIIHIIAGILVFLLSRSIFALALTDNSVSKMQRDLLSLFTALIFTAHPVQTQAVTYIVQRMTSLSAMFYIASIYLYMLGRLNHVKEGTGINAIAMYSGAFLCALFSFWSKQNAITIPASMLLVEFFFIRDKEGNIHKNYLKISISILAAIFFLVAVTGNLPRETENISRGDYLLTQLKVMIKYIQLLFLPINQQLEYDITPSAAFWDLKIMGCFILLAGIFISGIYLYHKNRLISFGIFWFFLTLSVESTIIPIRDLIFEHRLYLPMPGFALIEVSIIYKMFSGKRFSKGIYALTLIVLVLGIATFNRNKVWKTRDSLWADSVKKAPRSYRTNYNFGRFSLLGGQYDKAIAYFNNALELNPNNLEALNNLGLAYYYKGDVASAIAYYEKALNIKPDNHDVLNNLGLAYYFKGDIDSSISYYNRALSVKPDNIDTLINIGAAYRKRMELDRALEYLNAAYKIKPDNVRVLNNLGITYYLKGEYPVSIEYLEKALTIDPQDASSLNDLANSYVASGNIEKGLDCYKRSLKIKPDNVNTLTNLGTVYFAKGELTKAREYCLKALEINPKSSNALSLKKKLESK